MQMPDFLTELPVAITVCDTEGIILYMNNKSILTFTNDGGEKLIGSSLLNCHPQKAREKIQKLLEARNTNAYTIEKGEKNKFIFQTPWYLKGTFSGLVEFSFEIPKVIPHFIRK